MPPCLLPRTFTPHVAHLGFHVAVRRHVRWDRIARYRRSVRVNPVDGLCALCHQHRVLQKSHLLPKAIYHLVRGEKGPDLNPAIISGTSLWQSSSQATAYLVCVDCEQRFHSNWTLRNCYRADKNSNCVKFCSRPIQSMRKTTREYFLPSTSRKSIHRNSFSLRSASSGGLQFVPGWLIQLQSGHWSLVHPTRSGCAYFCLV